MCYICNRDSADTVLKRLIVWLAEFDKTFQCSWRRILVFPRRKSDPHVAMRFGVPKQLYDLLPLCQDTYFLSTILGSHVRAPCSVRGFAKTIARFNFRPGLSPLRASVSAVAGYVAEVAASRVRGRTETLSLNLARNARRDGSRSGRMRLLRLRGVLVAVSV